MLYWPVKSILTCAYTLYVYIHATCAQHFDIIYVYIYKPIHLYTAKRLMLLQRKLEWIKSVLVWLQIRKFPSCTPQDSFNTWIRVFFVVYQHYILGIDQNFQLKGPWTFLRISTYFHTEIMHLHEWQLKFIDAWENSLNQYVAASLEIWKCFTTSLGIEYPRIVQERLLVG